MSARKRNTTSPYGLRHSVSYPGTSIGGGANDPRTVPRRLPSLSPLPPKFCPTCTKRTKMHVKKIYCLLQGFF